MSRVPPIKHGVTFGDQKTASLTYIKPNVMMWEATTNLRLNRGKLQQLWVSHPDGKSEWRSIPITDEDE